MHPICQSILGLPRYLKRIIALSADVAMCMVSVWLAFYFKTGVFHALHQGVLSAVAISVCVAIPIFVFCGLYRTVFRYEGFLATVRICEALFGYAIIYIAIITVVGVDKVPRTVGFIQPLLLAVLIGVSRVLVRLTLSGEYRKHLPRVIIYGAGNTGRQLCQALTASNTTRVAAFVDDNAELHGVSVAGVRVYPPKKLQALLQKYASNLVLLAIPSASRTRRKEVIEWLHGFQCEVRVLPSVDMIAHGKITLGALQEVKIEDLLGREPTQPDAQLMSKNITGKVVLVTGAGGSIGSELCRQIVRVNPKTLLLVERSEFALYSIYHELTEKIAPEAHVVALLADVTNGPRLEEIMRTWHPETLYHAAAYKHVPMVEHNPLEAIVNNVFGTLKTARAAREAGVKNFVLISTDKAVRPTNVMGATKRLCELELQALAAGRSGATTFSMVRFGNVLGSSGSVVPRFREQIRTGGPITLTHKDIVRYFMTIPEASQLVIQAGAMGTGGDVFVLDMSSPVRIYDLACRMVQLSGLKVRDAEHPNGDIEIQITGLRPGEKLFEELLIADNPLPTSHPRIFKAVEKMIPAETLLGLLDELKAAVESRDRARTLEVLKTCVPEFAPTGGVADWVVLEQESSRA